MLPSVGLLTVPIDFFTGRILWGFGLGRSARARHPLGTSAVADQCEPLKHAYPRAMAAPALAAGRGDARGCCTLGTVGRTRRFAVPLDRGVGRPLLESRARGCR